MILYFTGIILFVGGIWVGMHAERDTQESRRRTEEYYEFWRNFNDSL